MATFEEDEYFMEGGADSDQEIAVSDVDGNNASDDDSDEDSVNHNNNSNDPNENNNEDEDENGSVSDNEDDNDDDEEIKQNPTILYQQQEKDYSSDEEDESDYSSDEEYNIKVDDEYRYNLMKRVHPEEFNEDYTYIKPLLDINRNKDNIIIDGNHKTLPLLTKYEKARILGLRISQLNKGAEPFIDIKERQIVDTHIIAEEELKSKSLPFIIMRPIPNGKKEYWSLQDLEIIEN